LGEFLSRPVKLRSVVVDNNPFVDFNMNPWFEFFNNTNIKKKLDNFAFIQCDLNIKIVVNASPFLYGCHLVAYRPLPKFHTVPNAGTISALGDKLNLIADSQCPHIWVLPQTSLAGTLVCPWFYYKNWLDVTSAADLNDMGTLYFQELIALKSANDATTYKVTYQVYAWASNVKLTGATTKLSVQGQVINDEWSDKPISRAATAVANIAKAATNIPYIGVYAKATELGASAISKMAALFGYSNPPVIENVMPVKNTPFGGIGCPNMSEPTGLLTLDPKNELSIDPGTVDLPSCEEMDINDLCSRESLLTSFVWKSQDIPDAYLFSSNVTPMVCDTAIITATTIINATIYPPMGHVARMFNYWRGDIMFRFKAICTQYHKGRLIISWDPLFRVATSTDIYTTSFTQVVDLTPEMDVTIRVPYLQARHYLTVAGTPAKEWSKRWADYDNPFQYASSESGTGTFNNGQVVVKVQNELSGPTDDAQICILVFVRAADNFELTNPTPPASVLTSAVYPQGCIVSNEETNLIVAGNPGVVIPEANLIYSGESVKSLRTLYRRQVLERIIPLSTLPVNVARNHTTISFRFTKWPKPPGYVRDAPSNASAAIIVGNVPYSWTNHTAITWMQTCFIGMKGSIRRSFNITTRAEQLFSSVQIIRKNETAGTELTSFAHTVFANTYGIAAKAFLASGINAGQEGLILNNQVTQTGITVECPHYYPLKFCGTQVLNVYQGLTIDDTFYHSYAMNMVVNPIKDSANPSSTIECYVGAGTDFTMFFFISTPILWTVVDPTPV
jgi:hypothetical protein